MKEMFPYEQVMALASPADPSQYVYRPVVPIMIFGSTQTFQAKGLLDTGAEESILSFSLIQDGLIDPDYKPGETGQIKGFGGSPIEVTYWTVDLALRLKRKAHRWRAKVAFSPERNDMVLGNAGFLRYFTVTFHGDKHYTTLRPNGKFPPASVAAP